MINVVFLLLIFFLMTAQIAPPDPFEIALPVSQSEAVAEGNEPLYVSADGQLAFGTVTGEAVFEAIAARQPSGDVLLVRADANADGATVAELVQRLARLDTGDIVLVTGSR